MSLLEAYARVCGGGAEILAGVLRDADVVFIHDPQPAPLMHGGEDRIKLG